ncbi:MAG: SHOCT domain-containing protein [Ferruginibacter sp.]|nr:SHOCT domain-containing protein [Chitinophagaceae bacterium]
MMKLLFAMLVCPLFAFAQNDLPRFENDTLYTSSGYKIFKGQTLQFGKGTGKNGTFRFIIIENGVTSNSLKNASIVVKELKNFKVASYVDEYSLPKIPVYYFVYGIFYIEITGTINYKDGSKGYIDIQMAFDKAIENSMELPSELIVPYEFRKNNNISASEEIKKSYILYKNGAITKEEYEAYKRKLLFMHQPSPLISTLQYIVPTFKNDTVYTSCGYKIYKGQTLQIGKPTGNNGKFRFINIKNGFPTDSLTNKKIVVNKLKNFGISSLGNGYVEIVSVIIYKDGSKGYIDIHMAFDYAIENSPDLPSELIVPDEFRNKQEVRIAKEINKLNNFYKDGALTKEEYEMLKKKLLERQ